MKIPTDHNFIRDDSQIETNQKRILIVAIISFLTMVLEVFFGYSTGSMALLADGWHMASHVGAMMISYATYRLASSSHMSRSFSFGAGKFIPLGGYTSAILLLVMSLFLLFESASRLIHPVAIYFDEAIIVAAIGLFVNIFSAFVLAYKNTPSQEHKDASHDHKHGLDDHAHGHSHTHHSDQNFKSAFFHILADSMTSVIAIVALYLGKNYQLLWVDAVMGVLGGVIIIKWAIDLSKSSAHELLDGHAKGLHIEELKEELSQFGNIEDFHLWRIAPKAMACHLIIFSNKHYGAQFYKDHIHKHSPIIRHIIVEERIAP